MGGVMEDTLLNPNQLRYFGVNVQDDPTSNQPLSLITEDTNFAMPLQRAGTIVFCNTRTPTQNELETCPHIQLSSFKPWDPSNVHFSTSLHSLGEEIERIRRVGSATTKSNIISDWANNTRAEFSNNIFDLSTVTRKIASMQVTKESKLDLINSTEPVSKNTDVKELHTFQSSSRHSDAIPQDLSERWFISISQATQTLKNTTQNLLRSAMLPLSRRYRADRMFYQKTLGGQWSTYMMDGHCISLDGNTYAQIFANESYFSKIYPMDSKKKAGEALKVFCKEFGVPYNLTFDGSKEQCCKGTTFMKQVRTHDI